MNRRVGCDSKFMIQFFSGKRQSVLIYEQKFVIPQKNIRLLENLNQFYLLY